MTEPARQAGGDQAVAAGPPPFLRITSTYPATEGRAETMQLEMHLDGGDDDENALWRFIDFCTAAIAAMRRPPQPTAIVLTGTGVLEELIRHVEDCDGSCGRQIPPITGEQSEPAGGEQTAEQTAEQTGQTGGS